jgi:quercetin dioxygenase-like cupin family protein
VTREEFEALLACDRYEAAIAGEYPPHCFNDFHTHPFDVRGLVLDGEMALTIGGRTEVFRTGEVFVMPVGVAHQEHVGPAGVRYLYGKKDS